MYYSQSIYVENHKICLESDEIIYKATKIIKKAIDNGIEYIDTAAAYGNSEQVIGKALSDCFGHKVKIITKPFPFVDYNSKSSDKVYLKSLFLRDNEWLQ